MSLEQLKTIIKDKPVSEIIALYVPVSKNGAQTLAVCPFHDDHDPSMNINDSKGMFFCFVDQIGGDSIKFVELLLRVSFIEAIKDISEKLGINYETYLNQNDNPKLKEAHYLLEKTTQLYNKMVWEKDNSYFDKFLNERNLSNDVAKTYRLGFAPKNNILGKYFSSIKDQDKKKSAIKMAKELQLIRDNKGQNDTYDHFRDRIIFPIWDHYGKVIGYTSRAISTKQKAKYLNSMESFLFKKRNLLYGLHLAKQSIRTTKSVIVVEGNMDQIALYKNGFTYSVAIMGTATSDFCVTTLNSMASEIYLSLDNDKAGTNATEKLNAQFMNLGTLPKFIDLTPEKDPDEFLEQNGPLEFQKRIDNAKLYLDVQIENCIPKLIPDSTELKLKVLKSIYPLLAPLNNDSELDLKARLSSVSKTLALNLDLQTIFTDFTNSNLNIKKIKIKDHQSTDFGSTKTYDSPTEHNSLILDKTFLNLEKTLLNEIILYPEIITHSDVKELLDFVKSDQVKNFVLDFCDFILEIDEQLYSKTLLSWANEQNYSTELITLIGANVFQYRGTKPNEKVLVKMREDLKYKLKEEYLKDKRSSFLKSRENVNVEADLPDYLEQLSLIDREINDHKKFKKNLNKKLKEKF